ncbi:MAG: phage tail protein [Myxococcales bacterium]|nr:phage tail protein [Myxococcales bacterium]
MTTRRAYTTGHFALDIDGNALRTAHIKSVEGGHVKLNSVDEQMGQDNLRIKHGTSLEVEPLTCEIGLSQANYLLWWIKKSWRKEFARHNGSITHADFQYKAQFVHQFFDALIEETQFPTLDSQSKDPAYLKVKFRPERVDMKRGGGESVSGSFGGKQKLWLSSAFRLTIDGVDTSKVSRIDAFSVKQGIKPIASGPARFPELVPTKIEFPDLSVTMSLQYADQVLDWYHQYVIDGKMNQTKAEKQGALEFLTPDRQEVLFRINLYDVGIKSFQIPKVEANQDQIKRCKFELYVGYMDLDNDGALGLE